MALSRRRALGLGFGGGLLVVLATLGLAIQPTVMVPPSRPLRVLSVEQYAILRAVAERMHPGKGPIPSASQLGVAEAVDELLASAHPGFAYDFGRALLVFESAAGHLVFDGQLRPFTRMTPEQQDRVLAGWREARSHLRRQIFHAMLGLCSAAYWGDPRTWSVMEYPGPPPHPRRG
jgi:hypothetical protein